MILPRFELHRPRTIAEALEVRAALGPDARWLAGGTQLLVAMKYGEAAPPDLVDLKRVAELAEISTWGEGNVRIGAGATYLAIRRHPAVRRACPALVDLVAHIGNPRVRAAGTLGGNLGFADPRWDPMTLLLALGADVGVATVGGTSRKPLLGFAGAAGGALITDVGVPATSTATYLKFQLAGRTTLGLALAGATEAGAFTAPPRVAVGAAVPAPALCADAAALLAERPLVARDPGVQRAAAAAAEEIDALSDSFASAGYKRRLVRVLLPRVVERLAAA